MNSVLQVFGYFFLFIAIVGLWILKAQLHILTGIHIPEVDLYFAIVTPLALLIASIINGAVLIVNYPKPSKLSIGVFVSTLVLLSASYGKPLIEYLLNASN